MLHITSLGLHRAQVDVHDGLGGPVAPVDEVTGPPGVAFGVVDIHVAVGQHAEEAGEQEGFRANTKINSFFL